VVPYTVTGRKHLGSEKGTQHPVHRLWRQNITEYTSAKKSQQIGGTNRRTNFSAKQVPSALDLSPRPQTHLPFGCSVVGVTWKPKISLNFSVSQWYSGVCPGLKINRRWCRSQKPQQVSRTKRPNHRNPTNWFNSRTPCFLLFL